MKNLQLKSLYYIFTYSLCLIGALSLLPLLKFWYFVFFAITCAWGMFFSANTQDQTKERVRFFIGIFLIIVSIFFWFKFPLDRSALPSLMLLFLLIIALSSFTVKNTLHLSVVHFESLFLIIFSTCLPFAHQASFRAMLLFVSLFIIIFLLQITRSKSNSQEIEDGYIITNINITRRFVLSFILSIIIVFAAGPLIWLVPKFSISLNLDHRGSSVVDFKTVENDNLHLVLPEKGKSPQITRNEIIPYVRSLFLPAGLREKIYKEEGDWKQPLLIEKKPRKLESKGKSDGIECKYASSDYTSGLDAQEKEKGDAEGGDSNKELSGLMSKILILKADISKSKMLYRLLGSFGDGNLEQKNRLNASLEEIKSKEQKLQLLKKQIEQANLNNNIKNDERYADLKKDMVSKGPGNFLLAKKTSGSNKSAGTGEGKDGTSEGAGEDKDGTGEGIGEGKDGTGEGRSESGSLGGESDSSAGGESGDSAGGESEGSAGGESEGSAGGESGDSAGGESEGSAGGESGDSAGGESGDSAGGESKGSAGGESGDSAGGESGDSAGGESEGSAGGESGDSAGGESEGSSDGESKGSAGGESDSESEKGSGDSSIQELVSSSTGGSESSDGLGIRSRELTRDTGNANVSGNDFFKKLSAYLHRFIFKFKKKDLKNKSIKNGRKNKLIEKGSGLLKSVPLGKFKGSRGKTKISKAGKKNGIKDTQSGKLKKPISPKSGRQKILPYKPNTIKKEPDNRRLERSKLKQEVTPLPQKLQEEKKFVFEKIRQNKVLFNSIYFFIILFAIIFVYVTLYLGFCVIRKIIRDLKMHYFCRYRPKLLIIRLYHNLRFVFVKTGQKTRPYLTPKEVAEDATGAENYFIKKEVSALTDAFIKVRYSNNMIDEGDVDKCIVSYNSMKNKIGENLDFWENLFLKLNMFSFLNGRTPRKIEEREKERFQQND